MNDRASGENAQPPVDPVMAEATHWFVTLRDGADEDAWSQFEAWCAADRRHAATYARLQRLWGASGGLDSLAGSIAPSRAIDRRTLLRGGAGAAAAVIAVLGGGRLMLGPHPFAEYRTGPGERRVVTLADGSRAELSTATALALDFSPSRRRVRLLQGEAWFDVAADRARPFEVEAAGGVTRALGTAFAVAAKGNGARVSVTRHRVRVTLDDASRELGEGRMLEYGTAGIGESTGADPARLAWRDGRLVFSGQPLGEVAAELDRWTGGWTVIPDERLARRPVTLMIGVEDADHGLEELADALPMRISRMTPFLSLARPI
ncbi:FecR family protein [Stakelama tenebrarum]|uniref:DUF4880 domain-containing protein n=1 Tax=Stakelama tenebrarum TaxID=2711215 RepID=A0A6G6Y2E4_9SPHN|nr:FecR domain-containing protein [Sphingosinithalassobacter tenebrarum]QIG79069.1 DUF4880 domain-containing protein [Sphingosinithalassobacter tenebrarum]